MAGKQPDPCRRSGQWRYVRDDGQNQRTGTGDHPAGGPEQGRQGLRAENRRSLPRRAGGEAGPGRGFEPAEALPGSS